MTDKEKVQNRLIIFANEILEMNNEEFDKEVDKEAQKIVKLFAIPDVVLQSEPLNCTCKFPSKRFSGYLRAEYCIGCKKPIAV